MLKLIAVALLAFAIPSVMAAEKARRPKQAVEKKVVKAQKKVPQQKKTEKKAPKQKRRVKPKAAAPTSAPVRRLAVTTAVLPSLQHLSDPLPPICTQEPCIGTLLVLRGVVYKVGSDVTLAQGYRLAKEGATVVSRGHADWFKTNIAYLAPSTRRSQQ